MRSIKDLRFTDEELRQVFQDTDINNDTVEVIENDEMFIIILEKETFYVLCKRLMDDEQQKILRDKFTGELAEGYHLITDK